MKRRTLGVACAALVIAPFAAARAGSAGPAPAADMRRWFTDIYNDALLLNTPFVESTWDEAAGTYQITDFYHVAVFGNAVLLKFGRYDAAVAGVSAATLKDHTIRTIIHAAAANKWVDPTTGTWGRRVYWDSTMESYFVAAAKLMWSDLDATTQAGVDTIIRGAANDIVTAGANSPSTNGLAGGYQGDSKIEEMGARSMPLAAALAWLPDDPAAGSWREWHSRWLLNMGGLPAADRANPTVVNGRAVADWNTARNIWDTFLVENHGTYAPIYQQSMGAYPGRNTIQFLLAGMDVPAELWRQPNDDLLWATMAQTGTDAGVPQDFMVADRHHLYGRELLPVTARAMITGDRYAARAEAMLAERLLPYVRYEPAGRLTKFSGEPKYEPEARAELAMAFLLHHWSDRLAGDVPPVSTEDYFARYSTAVDHGSQPGLLTHQSPAALAASASKPGYVKFAYHPQHDDWLFDAAGRSPSFLPSTSIAVQARNAHAYTALRDGFTGSATALTVTGGVVGFTTLPDGSVVYATSGVAAGEGALRLYNLTMPGVPGLDGDRTFTWAGGAATLPAQPGGTPQQVPGNWLNVDGRAGFVVRGGQNPISIWASGVTLSDGPATRMVIEGRPAQTADQTARHAAAPAPTSDQDSLAASLVGGQLSLFNLGTAALTDAAVTVPQPAGQTTIYQGTQHTRDDHATRYDVSLAAADARVAPARFAASAPDGGRLPAGLTLTVVDSRTVEVGNSSAAAPAVISIRSLATGEVAVVRVPAGGTGRADFVQGLRTPTTDLARGRTTYPTSPRPTGMTDPGYAVDGDPATAWAPGAAGRRMVVDLGADHAIAAVDLTWTRGRVPDAQVEVSSDGLAYRPFTGGTTARYVAVVVPDWGSGYAGLAELVVRP